MSVLKAKKGDVMTTNENKPIKVVICGIELLIPQDKLKFIPLLIKSITRIVEDYGEDEPI
jgi:hypothetical protein